MLKYYNRTIFRKVLRNQDNLRQSYEIYNTHLFSPYTEIQEDKPLQTKHIKPVIPQSYLQQNPDYLTTAPPKPSRRLSSNTQHLLPPSKQLSNQADTISSHGSQHLLSPPRYINPQSPETESSITPTPIIIPVTGTSSSRRPSKLSQRNLQSSRHGSNDKGSNDRDNCLSPTPAPKIEKKDEEEESVSMLPMVAAAFIGTCIGGPAIFAAGLKLGVFAAMGAGAMGYTTGKMFADNE